MPLSKCVRCDKLFDKMGVPVCGTCMPAEEADFELVRTYLAENPDTNAENVSAATGVDVACVLRMVDSGRIVNAVKAATVRCGRCGALAISVAKKLCTRCLDELNQELAKQRNQIKTSRRKEVRIDQHTGVRQSLDAKRDKST